MEYYEKKTMLRNKKKVSEDKMYSSNVELLTTGVVEPIECPLDPPIFDKEPGVVSFRLENF